MEFQNPKALLLAIAVAGCALFVAMSILQRSRLQIGAESVRRGIPEHAITALLSLVAALLVVVALARPTVGVDEVAVERQSVDVVFAVDVSLSMLARDEKPSRFERARGVLLALTDALQGRRLGLVAFSGSSATLLPMTLDHGAIRLFVEQLSVQAVDEPGTALDRAVSRSLELFEHSHSEQRLLVILTDGEDQSSDPVDVARNAAERAESANVEVVVVGVGTEAGGTLPLEGLEGDAVKRTPDGAVVVSHMRPDVLATLAANGMFVLASEGHEVEEIERVAASMDSGGKGTELVRRPREWFPVVLAAAFCLFLVEALWATHRRL